MIKQLLGRDAAGAIGDQLKGFTKRLTSMVDDTSTPFTAEMRDNALKHYEHYTGASGGQLTEDALQGIIKDAEAGLKPGQGAGLSNISKGNILTNAFNVDAGGGIGGNISAMAMGGLLGLGGAAASDGDVAHGAFIGSLVGGGIKGIGTGLAKNMEKRFVTDLLGDKAGSFAAREATEAVPAVEAVRGVSRIGADDIYERAPMSVAMHEEYSSRTYLELSNRLDPNMTVKELDSYVAPGAPLRGAGDDEKTIGEMSTLFPDGRPYYSMAGDIDRILDNNYVYREAIQEVAGSPAVPAQAAQSVRQQQIAAIGSMSDDALKEAGMGAKFKKDVLTGESGFNIGTATRLSGFGGAALTGMGFSAKKRDHRRGFNKHRGNRV